MKLNIPDYSSGALVTAPETAFVPTIGKLVPAGTGYRQSQLFIVIFCSLIHLYEQEKSDCVF